MADMEWLRQRSREIAREMEALPVWERASLRARLLELGKAREQVGTDNNGFAKRDRMTDASGTCNPRRD